VSFIDEHDLDFCYWCWNPNSDDTGGLVKDDWLTPEQDKFELLRPILTPRASRPTPSASAAD
jgi:endoglucanase